jgi:hypothetical protein
MHHREETRRFNRRSGNFQPVKRQVNEKFQNPNPLARTPRPLNPNVKPQPAPKVPECPDERRKMLRGAAWRLSALVHRSSADVINHADEMDEAVEQIRTARNRREARSLLKKVKRLRLPPDAKTV